MSDPITIQCGEGTKNEDCRWKGLIACTFHSLPAVFSAPLSGPNVLKAKLCPTYTTPLRYMTSDYWIQYSSLPLPSYNSKGLSAQFWPLQQHVSTKYRWALLPLHPQDAFLEAPVVDDTGFGGGGAPPMSAVLLLGCPLLICCVSLSILSA